MGNCREKSTNHQPFQTTSNSNGDKDDNRNKNISPNHSKQKRNRLSNMIFNRSGGRDRGMNINTGSTDNNHNRVGGGSASASALSNTSSRRMGSSNQGPQAAPGNNNGNISNIDNEVSPTKKSPENIKRRSNQPNQQLQYQQNLNRNRNNSNNNSSTRKSPTNRIHQSTNSGVGTSSSTTSLPMPIGLNGPTQFEFSPSVMMSSTNKNLPPSEEHQQQQYLSFLSSHTPIMNSYNTSITGSPVRTMGGGGGVNNVMSSSPSSTTAISPHRTSTSSSNSNEKRLCVMDLQPFYKTIEYRKNKNQQSKKHTMKEGEMNNDPISQKVQSMQIDHDTKDHLSNVDNNNYNDDDENVDEIDEIQKIIIEPITNPNQLMNEHVSHLLNTSLPLNRPKDHSQQQHSPTSSSLSPYKTSPTHIRDQTVSPVTSFEGRGNRNYRHNGKLELNEKMSLEEKLRRERQRIHSNGITQFGWTSMSNTTNQKTSSSSTTPPDSIRILVPLRGNIYIQDGVSNNVSSPLRLLYDKTMLEEYILSCQNNNNKNGRKRSKKSKKALLSSSSIVGRDASAIDPQLSPDGSMVAFVVAGEIYVISCGDEFYHLSNDDNNDNDDGLFYDCQDGRNDCDSKRDSDDIMETDPTKTISASTTADLVDCTEHTKPIRVTFGAMISNDSKNEYDYLSSEEEDDDDDNNNNNNQDNKNSKPKKRYGKSITHGLADFVAQEEMDRYRGFWWDEQSNGILFVKVDESCVPPYRITHQGKDGIAGDEANYEDHRYPFAGEHNPEVRLGYIPIDREFVLLGKRNKMNMNGMIQKNDNVDRVDEEEEVASNSDWRMDDEYSESLWSRVKWFDPPQGASEYLARVNWLPCGSACIQWQDRRQSKLVLSKIDVKTGDSEILHKEESDVWINLHHMFHVLPKALHPNECLRHERKDSNSKSLPKGSFSFLFASERTGYCHLYLYTYIPGDLGATLLRAVSSGDWIVENIVGVDMDNDAVYFTGTYDSPLERHLYKLPLIGKDLPKSLNGPSGVRVMRHVFNTFNNSSKKQNLSSYEYPPAVNTDTPPNPIRLTKETGMHSVVMDKKCRLFVDTCSDLNRPPSTKVFSIDDVKSGGTTLLCVLYDASNDLKVDSMPLPSPELFTVGTSDGTETLHAALYTPDPVLHGSGPYPLVCAVYGGPHVQRVDRSWNQCVDMKAQRLCSLGFAVVKCDNRGSSRRGLAFEAAIKKNLGRVEVLDQVAVVRNLIMKRIADPSNIGIYGWSYGGYLSAMCLCRAPDVFKVAIAGAPVTSWDGYDTHYTERYMGLPQENSSGYHEAAVFNHIQNMKGKLMIIHGLIDENVHFRHTARLINRLVASGKDYDLLIFPDERHSPRRLRDRVYMEKRMNEYFLTNLRSESNNNQGEFLLGHL